LIDAYFPIRVDTDKTNLNLVKIYLNAKILNLTKYWVKLI